MKKKISDVVYVPAINTQQIKQEIIDTSKPIYENQGVKYQGAYRDKSSGEIRNQNLRHIYTYLDDGALTRTITISQKRFVITNLIVYPAVQGRGAGFENDHSNVVLKDAGGQTIWAIRYRIYAGLTYPINYDFSNAPLIMQGASFSLESVYVLPATDVISFYIVGYEED